MRTRARNNVSKVAIRRQIEAARRAGMQIGLVEVRSDGSIVIGSATTPMCGEDIFDHWASRL